jgi:hypothetical protein
MNTLKRPSILSRAFWLLASFSIFTSCSYAQFATNLTIERTTFLVQEPVVATVTIINRSGADVVMSGSGPRTSWLSFDITDPTGRPVSASNMQPEPAFVFKAGDTIGRKITINDTYSMSEPGPYSLKATVYHPPSGKYFESNGERLTVTDARAFKTFPFGVPQNYPDAGRMRSYHLIVFRESDRTTLYSRLVDERSQSPLLTAQLGPFNNALEPQMQLDRENRLHAFFLAIPQIFMHIIITPDGKVSKRDYYRELENSRPTLITTATGDFAVSGGQPYDPNAQTAGSARPKGRSASEKPPGL